MKSFVVLAALASTALAGDFDDDRDLPDDPFVVFNVTGLHISQGDTPEKMTISWQTPQYCESEVRYGTSRDDLEFKAFGDSAHYTFVDYTEPIYMSGYHHHVSVPKLEPGTMYYYKAGDFFQSVMSDVREFQTLQRIGDISPMAIGIVGDLGMTDDSKSTLEHLSRNTNIDMIMHVGDLGYADCVQTKWDDYSEMVENLASRKPWMVGAGNHEIEGNSASNYFQAFEMRYRMNPERPAEFGKVTIPGGTDKDGSQWCCPSVFQMEYNYGNSFYSFSSGPMHSVFLNCYSTNDEASEQYQWFIRDMKTVDREITPWVVVSMHCPWYNSNTAHYEEQQAVEMRTNMEALFYEHKVNMVFTGHVHAYERTFPVYEGKKTVDGSVYLTIGDGGNAEGHSNEYHEPTPEWSAFRNGTQYGHGVIQFYNESHMEWQWHRNIDHEPVVTDSYLLCNTALGLNADCTSKY